MQEEWRTIEKFPNYMISNIGRIKSLNYHRTGKEQILKQNINGRGYYYVNISSNGKYNNLLIHREVAKAFLKNGDINKTDINHKDGNKLNNYYENLEWCTLEYNVQDAWKTGLMGIPKGKENKMFGRYGKNANKSKPVYQYDLDYNFIKKWDCQRDVQRELGFSEKSISNCVLGNQKTAYGYIWLDKLKELKEGQSENERQ